MQLTTFYAELDLDESLDNFRDLYFSSRMKYFASDLLEEGLKPLDLVEAIRRAIAVGKTYGLEIREHFRPVYTHNKGSIIRDCKLSQLGYALVIMNARPEAPVVASFQMKLLRRYLSPEK